MDALTLRHATVNEPAVAALLGAHAEHSSTNYPSTSCHTLSQERLGADAEIILTLWSAEKVLAVGALVPCPPDGLELKSIHVAEAARGQGFGGKITDALIAEARARGARALWLETGASPASKAARETYASRGFLVCPPFGSYTEDPLSVFMTLPL
ncbi:MAG: GNAT family N-acetyltransferase [Pseudomonadota bacterium]